MASLLKTRKWLSAAHKAGGDTARFATLVGVHRRTLQRRFRKEFDCTISDWLKQLRLQKARSLARRGMGTTALARSLGFKSVPTFCREFKKQHGKTVAQMQKRSRSR